MGDAADLPLVDRDARRTRQADIGVVADEIGCVAEPFMQVSR